jgi:endonuclease I
MASKVKRTTQKTVQKRMKQAQKKSMKQLVSVLLVIAAAAITYWYTSNLPETETPSYSSDQNSEGFYYYHSVGSSDYYGDANLLVGDALRDELNQIITSGFTALSYADAKTVLEVSDQSLSDSTKVYNVYNGLFVPAVWDSTSWHREHVWPNSRLGIERVSESSRNQGSDMHNLRAITPAVNSSRSDRFFSEGSGEADITDDGGFYPGDAHQGDVARILFYMAVKYDFLILTDDGLLDESNHYTMEGVKMGKLSLLLAWHKEDPVDDFERNRNQKIFEAQGNRNPFIDKPEYVHLIWENKTIGDLTAPISTVFHETVLLSMIIEKRGF